jgi:hypothetical protein
MRGVVGILGRIPQQHEAESQQRVVNPTADLAPWSQGLSPTDGGHGESDDAGRALQFDAPESSCSVAGEALSAFFSGSRLSRRTTLRLSAGLVLRSWPSDTVQEREHLPQWELMRVQPLRKTTRVAVTAPTDEQ